MQCSAMVLRDMKQRENAIETGLGNDIAAAQSVLNNLPVWSKSVFLNGNVENTSNHFWSRR